MRAISLSVLPVALASTQVYLSPGPTETLPVVSTSEDARGLVSHHLGLSRFAQASTLQFSDALQTILNSGDPFQHADSRDSLLVLFQGPAEVIPQQLKPSLLVEDSPEQEVQWEDYLKGLLQRSAAWLQYEVQGLGQLWREAVQGLKDVSPSDSSFCIETLKS